MATPTAAALPDRNRPTDAARPSTPRTLPSEPEPPADFRELLSDLGPPSLVTLQQNGDRCEWAVLRPPQIEPRIFMLTQLCPSNSLVWDRRGGRTFFSVEGELYLHDWKAATVDDLGPGPTDSTRPELGVSATGALRICDYEERPVEGDNTAAYRITLERQQDGSWQPVREDRLGYEQSTQSCSGPQDTEASGSVFYEPQPQRANNCRQDEKASPSTVCPSPEIIERVRSQVSRPHDDFEYLSFGPAGFLAYPVSIGESVHVVAPVFALAGDQITPIYDRALPSGALQWDILTAGEFFLVRAESGQTHATLFKKGQLEPLKEFPDDMRVIWIPGTLGTGEVIEVVPADTN